MVDTENQKIFDTVSSLPLPCRVTYQLQGPAKVGTGGLGDSAQCSAQGT